MQSKKSSGSMSAFETELLESVCQAVAGDFKGAAILTPQAIAAKRGRPVGSHESPTTLLIDDTAFAAGSPAAKAGKFK